MNRLTIMAYSLVACLLTIFAIQTVHHQPRNERAITSSSIQVIDDQPLVKKQPTVEETLKFINQKDLRETVGNLSNISRVAGSADCKKAANHIEQLLKAYGLQTMQDPFKWNNVVTDNVYGWIDGKELPDEIVVVGAHYDDVSRTPGADDNASGTAEVLAIAKAFSHMGDLRRTIVFQLYSAEESGLWGSNFYCNYPKFPRNSPGLKKHVFMLNIDMVGYLDRKTYTHGPKSGSVRIESMINELTAKYPFANQVTFRGQSNAGESDHASFYRYSQGQIPLVWLFTGLHSNYHKPSDTPDKLNYDGMEKIGRYAFEMLYKVVQEDIASSVRYTDNRVKIPLAP